MKLIDNNVLFVFILLACILATENVVIKLILLVVQLLFVLFMYEEHRNR